MEDNTGVITIISNHWYCVQSVVDSMSKRKHIAFITPKYLYALVN